jgi:oxygen-dependent protoporphyrinogen oxidase
MDASERKRIAVLGGGICGLSAALGLRRAAPAAEVHVFESAARCGGVLGTLRRGDLLLETGPLAFPAGAPATSELLAAAGHAGLAARARAPEGAGIWQGDRVAPLARTPAGILRARLVSARGLARLALEPFIPPCGSEDESVGDFFRRRTGAEFLDAVMEPLCSAIQAGDPAALGMEANYPGLRAWERKPGRMARGLWEQERSRRRRAKPPMAMAAGPEGNGPVVEALAAALERMDVRFRLGASVEAIIPCPDGGIAIRAGGASERFDACISCLRAHDLARAFPDAPGEVREFLDGTPYASVALAYLAYRKDRMRGGFAGAHCLVPARTGAGALSLSIPSRMQAGRCGGDRELVRVSLGGMRDAAAADLPEAALRTRASAAAARILGLDGPPEEFACVRQPGSLPQLLVGHPRRLARARERLARDLPSLMLSGTGCCGAGIEKAAQEGKRAALELAARLQAQA